jgi:hypothetical protein
MTTQNFDIKPPRASMEATLAGMKVINKEKAEIALILWLLAPCLYEIAHRELYRAGRMLIELNYPYEPLKVFYVQSGGKNSLELVACRERDGISCSVTFENGSIVDRTTILHRRWSGQFDVTPEQLGAEFVDTCRHDLLPFLMEEVAKRNPDVLLPKLETFYAAAKRSDDGR